MSSSLVFEAETNSLGLGGVGALPTTFLGREISHPYLAGKKDPS